MLNLSLPFLARLNQLVCCPFAYDLYCLFKCYEFSFDAELVVGNARLLFVNFFRRFTRHVFLVPVMKDFLMARWTRLLRMHIFLSTCRGVLTLSPLRLAQLDVICDRFGVGCFFLWVRTFDFLLFLKQLAGIVLFVLGLFFNTLFGFLIAWPIYLRGLYSQRFKVKHFLGALRL